MVLRDFAERKAEGLKLLKEIHTQTPRDSRYPGNQTRACFYSYVDFHRCSKKHGEEDERCQYYKRAVRDLCFMSWVEKWDDRRERGTFQAEI